MFTLLFNWMDKIQENKSMPTLDAKKPEVGMAGVGGDLLITQGSEMSRHNHLRPLCGES